MIESKDIHFHVFMWIRNNFKTAGHAADSLSLHRTNLSRMVSAKQKPNPRVLDAMGLEEVISYRKKPKTLTGSL